MKTLMTVLITFLVSMVLAAVGFVIYKIKYQAKNAPPAIVRLEKPQIGELTESINAPGQIEPKKHVEISAKISARITELPFEEGDRVTKGDPNANPPIPPSVVIKLDSTELEALLKAAKARRDSQAAQLAVTRAQIESQKARLIGTEASLAQAKLDLERQLSLLKSHDVSQSVVDQARTNVEELQSQLASARETLKATELGLKVQQHTLEAANADIARAEDNLSYTTITSPIDGIITRINAEEGEMVITGTMNNPGTVIMEIADLNTMLVLAQVDERDIAGVRVGQQAKVHIHTWPDKVFRGVVETVALSHKISNTGSKYFETEILLDKQGERVLSGLTADVDIEIKTHKNIMKIPSQAVLARQVDELPLDLRDLPEVDKKKTFTTVVYRYIEDAEKGPIAVVTPVTTGVSDATHTIIKSGITPDDLIIVGPYKVLEKIKHEQKVKDEKTIEKKLSKKPQDKKTSKDVEKRKRRRKIMRGENP